MKFTIPKKSFEKFNLKPCKLGPKDGLSLINGTAVMAALNTVAIVEARKIVKIADIGACVTLESVKGSKRAYDLTSQD